jgi:glyoxylase-like metal-dependent hydrolase (beta-lactamase superfamily II)
VEEIVPGIYGIGFGYVNAFLVADDTVTLVDSGIPKKAPKLRRALAEASPGRRLSNVVITHHHMDHVGSLGAIAPEGVTVWAHPLDAGVIRGEAKPAPAPRNGFERIGVKVADRLVPTAPPARVDREISDGQEIPIAGGLTAFHTPGHTAGHVSYLMPSKRVLFVGDAAANLLGRLGPPFGIYSEDHDAVRKSIAKIAALDFDIACFGHGRVLKGSAAAKFRTLADKVAG